MKKKFQKPFTHIGVLHRIGFTGDEKENNSLPSTKKNLVYLSSNYDHGHGLYITNPHQHQPHIEHISKQTNLIANAILSSLSHIHTQTRTSVLCP